MGVSKTSDHIQIKIKMPNLSQEPSVSSKAPNEDLKDMDVLCTIRIKIGSQNSEHGHINDQRPYLNLDQDAKPQSVTSSFLQSQNQDLKEMDEICTCRIKVEIPNLEHRCTKDQWS